VARQAAALQAEERRRGTLGLGKNRAAVAVELGEGSAGSFIGGQVGGGGSGAGERDGTRRRVADGPVRGSSMGGPRGGALGKRRPRAGGAVPQSPALCARLVTAPCRLGAAQLRRARACAVVARAAGGARPGGARGEEDRPGRARCATGAGPKGGVPGWRARPGEQGARGGRGPGARQRRKEREEGRREKKGKRRKWEKEKKKKKEGKEKGKRREGERDPRRDHGADRGACRPRVASGRARTRRTGREIGCRIRVSGLWEIGRSGGTGKIPETGVRVSRRDLELNDEAEF